MKPILCKPSRFKKNYNSRIRFLLFHYTARDFSSALDALTGPDVSAHYLIPDISDPSYQKAGYCKQEVFKLVDEQHRAWHAGTSAWGERSHLNDTSIGVEIVNLASYKDGVFSFPPYHPAQIAVIEELALDILRRYPDITPTQVLGHNDVSIGRKSDPGPRFPWRALYLQGVGAWFDEATQQALQAQYTQTGVPERAQLLKLFKTYGYDVRGASTEQGFSQLVRAFQMHFRPEKYNGVMDAQTAANLAALVGKYFS